MTNSIYVKPAKGMVVRDPVTRKPLPEDGAEVPRDSYWLRRLNDGDVAEATRPKKTKSKES